MRTYSLAAQPQPRPQLQWHAAGQLTLEGKTWPETLAPFDRLPARAKGGVGHLDYLRGGQLLGTDGEGTVDGFHPTDPGFPHQRFHLLISRGRQAEEARLRARACLRLPLLALSFLFLRFMRHPFQNQSMANVSQLATLDKAALTDRVGKVPKAKLNLVLEGINIVFER